MDSNFKLSFPAASDLSTKQFYFVTVQSSGKLALTGDGLRADGILQDKPAADGRAGSIVIAGRSRVVAGAGFLAGTPLASDTNGKAVTATSAEYVNAFALQTAKLAGDIVEVNFVGAGGKA